MKKYATRMKTLLLLVVSQSTWFLTCAEAAKQQEPYDNFYCMTCHGSEGRGNFGVQAPKLAGMETWYLERQLKKFREGIRGIHPQDIEGRAMRPMADKLSDKEIKQVVSWVGQLPPFSAQPTLEGDPVRGASLYVYCVACHGVRAEGNPQVGGPALAGQNDWYLFTQLRNFKKGYRGQHPKDLEGAMMAASMQSITDDKALLDVVSFINQIIQ